MNNSDHFDFASISKKDIKPLNKIDLYNLGLTNDSLTFKANLEELRNSDPNIVAAECIKNVTFIQNQFKTQSLKKKVRYGMGLGIYQQLHYDPRHKIRILRPSSIKLSKVYKPYIGQDLNDKTLFVSRTGGIGDLLFIQPNLRFLKEKYPTCTIKFACGPQYQSMVETWDDCIDELLDLPFVLNNFLTADYHALFEGVIERCYEAHTTNAYRLFSKWLGLDLPDNLLIPKQEPKEEMVEKCKKVLFDWNILDSPFIFTQLRASTPIRTPRPAVWKSVIKELLQRGHKIIITDSPKVNEMIQRFISEFNNENLFNFTSFSESIDHTIAMASLAPVSLTVDSSLVHIAISLGKKAFGIYGPFPGEIRLGTYGERADWINVKKECAPCFIHGSDACKHAIDSHGTCFDSLDPIEVANRVEKLLE